MLQAITEVEGRARNYAALLGYGFDERKRPSQLEEAIRAALGQADTYDREVFESMGVKTIWVNHFDEIPDIISAIGGVGGQTKSTPPISGHQATRKGPS